MRGLCLMAIRNHSQADDLWARFKVPEWGVFCHTARLRNRPARLKLVLSDSTQSPLVWSKLSGSWNADFGQILAIFRFLEFVKFRNSAKSYKETWRSNFSAVWVLNDHVGVGSRAIL